MRFLCQPRKRQRFAAFGDERAIAPSRGVGLHLLSPDRHGRGPQAVEEDDARRRLGRVREVVGRVAGARCRGKDRRPARVAHQRVLFGLAHGVRIAARLDRQVGPVGDRHLEHVGGPAQPTHAGDGLA